MVALRILYFGRYNPHYSRNAVLLKGLRLNGVDVLECRVAPAARFWPLRLIWKYVHNRSQFDGMLVAFPGQEVMLLARLLTRKPIIFDAFTSHYEGYVQDRRKVSPASWRSRWYWFIDWLACRLATEIITDTQEHARYFTETFHVPKKKIHVVLLSTMLIEDSPEPERTLDKPFTIHFHGSNIPLQGIEVIWGAVRRLRDENIHFQMIGPFTVPIELAGNIEHEVLVPFEELHIWISRAHVCLGIFGSTAKAGRVIPNKVYEGLAMKRALITADTPAIRELISERDAMLIRAADSDALAHAIMLLKSDAELRGRLAAAGYTRLLERATPVIVGRDLKAIYERITLRA